MSATPSTIIVTGNLTDDPSDRTTAAGGKKVSNFTIAATPRFFDREANEWKDGETTFYRSTVWDRVAENVIASLTKGSRVIAIGKIKPDTYTDKDGVNHNGFKLEIDEIGPSLEYATATVTKNQRGGNTAAPAQQAAPAQAAPAQAAPARAAAPAAAASYNDADDVDFS